MKDNLPTLTIKQQKFVMAYLTNGNNSTSAYKSAYNTQDATDKTINVEASRLLKNPKITQWIDFYRSNIKKNFEEKAIYTIEQAMEEYDELKNRISYTPKYCNVEKSIIDSKCKLTGLFTDKIEHSANNSLIDFLDKLD